MFIIKQWFIKWHGTALISVVVFQNHMDLLNGEPGSSDDTRGKSTHYGNELIGIEAEKLLDIPGILNQESTIPALKTEPDVSGVPMVDDTYISYRPYLNLSSLVSVCPCKTNICLDGFRTV